MATTQNKVYTPAAASGLQTDQSHNVSVNGVQLSPQEYTTYKNLLTLGNTASTRGESAADYYARAAAMTGNNQWGLYDYNHDTGTWTTTGKTLTSRQGSTSPATTAGGSAGSTSRITNPTTRLMTNADSNTYNYETGTVDNYTPGSGNVGYTKQGTPFTYNSNLSGSGVAANLATGGMRNNFASTGSSSKDNYINGLVGSGYSNPYKNTPFSRFVNQNLYADRYF